MARLIDADALKTSIYNYANEQVKLNDRRWDSKCTAIIVDMHGIVDRAPTVDAKPVKTAQLIRETDRERHWHCSDCGKVFGLVGLMHKYCPECGARLTGGGRDAD